MKKRRLWLLILSLIISICACFCIAACSTDNEGSGTGGETGGTGGTGSGTTLTALAVPENLTAAIQGTDAGKVILNWNAVEGASGYAYIVNGDEQSAVTVEKNSATVDLAEIDAAKLDKAWAFQVKALGSAAKGTADGNYCEEVKFAVSNDEIYTVAEILKIMNYYGENLPSRDFTVTGTIAANSDGDAVLENGFTLFGDYVPELYLGIDGRLVGLNVTARGTLALDGGVKGLSSYRSVDFISIEESDRYELVIDTLKAWDMLEYGAEIVSDFYLPVKLYGVNILWTSDEEAFEIDDYGNVTVTCPAYGEKEIDVVVEAMLYVDANDTDDSPVLQFLVVIIPDSRTEELAAPKININPKTGVATWNEVEHATGYRVTYYGFSVPGDYYSDYVSEELIIYAGGERAVELKDTWWITVQALGDGTYRNSDIASKQYNYYPETTEPDGTPLEFDLTKLTQTGTLSNADYIFGLACDNASVFVSASANRVELGNSDSNGVVTGTGFIKVGSASNDGKITLNFNKKILGVVITARQWNKDQKDKISVNGSEQQTASKNDWGVMYFNFTANKASTKVEIDTDNRVFIQSIIVYVAD